MKNYSDQKGNKDKSGTNDDIELRKHIEMLEKKCEEYELVNSELTNNWKRALADYQNLQKRTAEDRLNFTAFATASIVRRLLSVLDNLEIMQRHSEDSGLKMIINELKNILSDEGLKEIETFGKDFDPKEMEAIETVDGEENKVVEVLQKGYFFKEKLLRPARVKVGHGNKS